VLDDQRREQAEEVEEREGEQPARGGIGGMTFGHAQDAPGERHEHRAGHRGDPEIDHAAGAEIGRRQAGESHDDAIGEDLHAGRCLAGNDGQHRHAGALVIAGAHEGQRPEVRRRPEKDDGEQDDAFQ
jgi:hypothetical protein